VMGTLANLLAQLDPDSKKRKGAQFEAICRWFLENDPRSGTWSRCGDGTTDPVTGGLTTASTSLRRTARGTSGSTVIASYSLIFTMFASAGAMWAPAKWPSTHPTVETVSSPSLGGGDALVDKWDEGYQRTAEYAARHQTACVPFSHKTDDGYSLGSWVITQRVAYAQEKLSLDRQHRLESLTGWVWRTRTPNRAPRRSQN
jgi:hypothetical protein